MFTEYLLFGQHCARSGDTVGIVVGMVSCFHKAWCPAANIDAPQGSTPASVPFYTFFLEGAIYFCGFTYDLNTDDSIFILDLSPGFQI